MKSYVARSALDGRLTLVLCGLALSGLASTCYCGAAGPPRPPPQAAPRGAPQQAAATPTQNSEMGPDGLDAAETAP